MVGKCEAVVLVDHEARCRGSGCVGVPVALDRRRVDLREELPDRFGDRVCPAERADDALLFERIALLVCQLFADPRHPGRLRPVARVRPVRVFREYVVSFEEGLVAVPEEGLDVPAVARPVHEARRLVGRVVEVVDPDLVRHLPRDRLVLVRRYFPVQRHDQPQPRLGLCVLVRRVDRHRPVDFHVVLEDLPEVLGREIRVEREDLPRCHAAGLALAFLQVPADEAADVLEVVLLVLGHLHIFRMRLPGL